MDTHTIEKTWQAAWKKAKLFEAEKNDKPKFFITIPYPYISGSLHIGHARVVTEADVYARFLRMTGKNVLFPIAFHISGTPVLGISLAIKNNDKSKIDLYKNYVKNYINDEKEIEKIVKSFEDPEKIVEFFIPKMKEEFSTLGLSVDWRRSYTSGDIEHQRLVEWQFRKYKQNNYLVQAKYPVLYSKELENAVGEDDIVDGDTDPVEKQEFTLIKFKYEEKFLVAATLRPETMFGQTNLWVNPDTNYVIAKVDKEIWVASEECFDKLVLQEKSIKPIGKINGMDLLGKYCHAPFLERDIIILPSKHCNPDRGTGIVTSVPSDAPFDWVSLKLLQDSKDLCQQYHLDNEKIKRIQLIPIIASKGYSDFPAVDICKKMNIISLEQHAELEEATQEIYKTGFHTGLMKDNCGKFSGMPVVKAKEEMKAYLLKEKNGSTMFETSRPAKARDGSKVVVALLDNQWFLDFNARGWKEKAHQALDHCEIVPDKYRKQFEDTFVWLDKRPCARRRGLGTKLPFDNQWVIESLSDSTVYMALYPICHKLRGYKIKGDKLTEEFFDYVLLGEGNIAEVEKKTGVKKNVLEELHEDFDYWYPFDHRHTFAAHLSNHLSFMLFAHAGIFPKSMWPKKITFHGMVISGGAKMSKSKGNVVTLLEINEKYGADAFRAFICNSTSIESTFNWETKEVEKMRLHLESIYRLLDSFINHRKKGKISNNAMAMVSKIEKTIKKCTEHLKKMELRDYSTLVLFELLNIYKKGTKKLSHEEIEIINDYLLPKWITLLSPLTPFLAEDLWKKSGEKGFVSVAKWIESDKSKIDPIAEYKEELIDNVENDINTVCQLAKINNPSEIILFVADSWKYEFLTLIKELMKETRDQKAIMSAIMKTDMKKKGEQVMKLIPLLLKDPSKMPDLILDQETEISTLNAAELEKRFNCIIKIYTAESTTEAKAKIALPGKPAILVR